MKCIVIETSPERVEAHTVTNEDGTPHIYATMAEARAELKANGYSYNRENQRYYIKGTECRAYIIREDSEEYAEAIEQAEQEAAPEYIEPEHIQTVGGNKIYRSTDPVTGWSVFTVAGRDFWELAEARYFAQCNPTEEAERAEIIAAIEDPEERTHIEAEATAHQWSPEETAEEIEYRHDARARKQAEPVTEYETEAAAMTALWNTRPAADLTQYASKWAEFDAAQRDIYQRHELEAYLGEPDAYDLAAIEAEATEPDYTTGRIYWRRGVDLAAIAERHELYQYAAI